MNDFLYKHPLIVTWGLVLGIIAAVMGVYNAYLQDEHRVCTVYADKHGGHVETYIKCIANGTSYIGYRVELPNRLHITADEIKRISATKGE